MPTKIRKRGVFSRVSGGPVGGVDGILGGAYNLT